MINVKQVTNYLKLLNKATASDPINFTTYQKNNFIEVVNDPASAIPSQMETAIEIANAIVEKAEDLEHKSTKRSLRLESPIYAAAVLLRSGFIPSAEFRIPVPRQKLGEVLGKEIAQSKFVKDFNEGRLLGFKIGAIVFLWSNSVISYARLEGCNVEAVRERIRSLYQ